MKRCLSPCRHVRLNATKFARSTIVGLALLGATSVELGAFSNNSELRAQSIINNARPSDNNALKSFSVPSDLFDQASVVDVKLPAPKTNSAVVDASEYKFTFYFPQNADSSEITAIDLLCSPDKGKTWHACAVKQPTDKNKDFLFHAPEPGEYWFVLMTSFKSGENSFSSTKGLIFTQGANAIGESFALADDGEPTIDASPNNLAEISDLAAPPILRQNDEELLVDNASFAAEDVQPELTTPTAPQLDAPELRDMEAPPEETSPRPGKLRNLSFGVGKGTGSLLVTVRWFRPEDIDARYAVDVKSLSVERAPSPTGPWTIVAEDLDVNQSGYSWTATPEEMKPFYVRTVARDAQGNVWRDVTTSPMDVNQPGVRSALGPVKTPAPFADVAKKDKDDADDKSDAKEKTAMIRYTASENDEPADGAENDASGDVKGAKQNVRLVSTVERSQSKSSVAQRERPYVPAPTNPNEFQLNPLFTKGFSVLYQSSQARMEPSGGEKRSIFTPPSRSSRNSYVRPAERRYSPREIAAARIEQERKAYQERLQYNKEHEMESFEQNPQLMEGRMFYMDSDGNLTTTPPPEMQKALVYGGLNMEAQGWTRVDQPNGLQGGMTTAAATPDGEPIYMPSDAEAYDASARSGAAIWSNEQYPQASNPGSSPLNNRYSNGANAAPQGMGTGVQTVPPQSSYTPSNYGSAPQYFSNASSAPTTSNYAFPPQPIVSY